jgi:hypothetical protein
MLNYKFGEKTLGVLEYLFEIEISLKKLRI